MQGRLLSPARRMPGPSSGARTDVRSVELGREAILLSIVWNVDEARPSITTYAPWIKRPAGPPLDRRRDGEHHFWQWG